LVESAWSARVPASSAIGVGVWGLGSRGFGFKTKSQCLMEGIVCVKNFGVNKNLKRQLVTKNIKSWRRRMLSGMGVQGYRYEGSGLRV